MNTETENLERAAARTQGSKIALLGLALGLAGSVGASGPAHAADTSQSVSVADLDLSTTEGRKAAQERLHQAARRLCNRVVDTLSISRQPDYVQCVEASTNAAVAQLQHVIAVADAKTLARQTSSR